MKMVLPVDSAERKATPMARGLLDYFPGALAEVSRLSLAATEKHNPGEEMHWSRGKSSDHADTIIRHLVDRGTIDPDDGVRHSAKVAWRALALLQEELEADGALPGRGSRFPATTAAACWDAPSEHQAADDGKPQPYRREAAREDVKRWDADRFTAEVHSAVARSVPVRRPASPLPPCRIGGLGHE